jgi:hypothetical protein
MFKIVPHRKHFACSLEAAIIISYKNHTKCNFFMLKQATNVITSVTRKRHGNKITVLPSNECPS